MYGNIKYNKETTKYISFYTYVDERDVKKKNIASERIKTKCPT